VSAQFFIYFGIVLCVLVIGAIFFIAWKNSRHSSAPTANQNWVDETPEDDTDRPGLKPAYWVQPDPDDVATSARAAETQDMAAQALPEDDYDLEPYEMQTSREFRSLGFVAQMVAVLVGVWMLSAVVTLAGGWSISTPKPHQMVAEQASPTPPPRAKIKPHSSHRTKAKARAKARKARRKYRQQLREFRAQQRERLHIPVWILVLVVPILFVSIVAAVVATVNEFKQRRYANSVPM